MTDPELRDASNVLLAKLDQLRDLEGEKRVSQPGTTRFVELSRAVEVIAEGILSASSRQTEQAIETLRRPDTDELQPIAEMAPARDAAVILDEWRAAERKLATATPGSAAFEVARSDVARLREEYRRTFEAHRAEN